MFKLLTYLTIIAASLVGQTPQQPLAVTKLSNVTTYIDNRSVSTRHNDLHTFQCVGTGTWTCAIQYADTTPTGWTNFPDASYQISNLSTANRSQVFGYHDFIKFVTTGTVAVNYSGTSDLYTTAAMTTVTTDTSALTYTPPFTGGVPRLQSAKNADIVNMRDYGAVCDGITDAAPAFNAATLANKVANSRGKVTFTFPTNSTCVIASPVQIYSGQVLTTTGRGVTIKASAGFVGSNMFELADDGSTRNRHSRIQGFEFDDSLTSGLAAIRCTAYNCINFDIYDITLNTRYGVMLETYTQQASVDNLYSIGPIETALSLAGNDNIVRRIDLEGGSGSIAGCHVQIIGFVYNGLQKSSGNTIEDILIETGGSVNKTPLCISDVYDTTIRRFWCESTHTTAQAITVTNADNTVFEGFLHGLFPNRNVSLTNAIRTRFDEVLTNNVPNWQSFVTMDSLSTCHANRVYAGFNQDSRTIDTLAQCPSDEIVGTTIQKTPVTGFFATSRHHDHSGENLLTNGSFEAGSLGWTLTGGPTCAYVQSEVDSGLMAKCTFGSNGTYDLRQTLTIPTEWVGRYMTISYKAKIVGPGTVSPLFYGAGFTGNGSLALTTSASGWNAASGTIYLTQSGSLVIGIYMIAMTTGSTVSIDDVTLSFGSVGMNYSNKFKSLDVADRLWDYGTIAPTATKCNAGQVRWNTSPTASGIPGWVCIADGSPSVWSPMPPLGVPPSLSAYMNIPAYLRFMGDGSDGPINCSGNLNGTKFVTTFTVSLGNTCTASTGAPNPLTIYAQGACTIAGTLNARGVDGGSNGLGDAGGSGGGGGGGTGAGTDGKNTDVRPPSSTGGGQPGGTGGLAGGGIGADGVTPYVDNQRIQFGNPKSVFMGGGAGGAGGSSGPAGGKGGGGMVLICASINFTGTIDVRGAAGENSTGNNVGASGGGGGGYVWLIARDSIANSGTINVTGGAGGTCGAFSGCGAGGAGGAGVSKIVTMQ